MLALRSGKPGNLYGFAKETPEGQDLQTQAPQAHEGEPPQEASALQIVNAALVRPPRLRLAPPEATILNMISGKNGSAPSLRGVLLCLAFLGFNGLAVARPPLTTPSPPDLGARLAVQKKGS